ncbi:MAG: 30S ribosomal protein S8 [Candidatus Riflemargulisbacteria bacterium]|jgi:small subunit ribosomal protein S8
MSVSDPIADMICIIKNGINARKVDIQFPFSKIKFDIVTIMQKEGFFSKIEKIDNDNKPIIKVSLKYNEKGKSVLNDMVKQSTPGKRQYLAKEDIPKVKSGFGISILSTNKGVISGKNARIKNVGGEILCYVW